MNDRTFPHAVHDYYLARVRALIDQYDQRIAGLRTRADALEMCDTSRRKLRKVFGVMPAKTPLNIQVTGNIPLRGYAIEKLIFESRPGYYVTANRYVPDGDGPFPAVLVPCGHSHNGKAWQTYQTFCHNLARLGYVVLIYDPVSQGERAPQYTNKEGRNKAAGCTYEHNMAGNHMTLLGDNFAKWRAWDGIRALDALLARGGVDPTRLGVSGCSGGGTLSTYLNALDDRYAMAGPDCFITTYLRNLENELPADAEQIPPGILAEGLEMADFFIAQAPRPTILLGEQQDFFDVRGLRQTFERVRKVYALLGKPDNIQYYIGPGPHGYAQGAREAAAGFFSKHARVPGSPREPKIKLLDAKQLAATPKGDVLKLPGARRVCDFTRERAEQAAAKRGNVSASKLPGILQRVLDLPPRPQPPAYRNLQAGETGDAARRGFPRVWYYALETEPNHRGLTALLQFWDPQSGKPKLNYHTQPTPAADVTLYLPHVSSEQDIIDGHAPRTSRAGLFTLDVRGIGRMMPNTCGNRDFWLFYGFDYFYASHGQMLNESFVGRRVHDLLSALDLLQSCGTKRVHLHGRGIGAVIAAMGAVLHPLVKRVSLRNGLRSYHELAVTPWYEWPVSIMPWAGLNEFDLPDCYRALKHKKLSFTDPWDARMRPARPSLAKARG